MPTRSLPPMSPPPSSRPLAALIVWSALAALALADSRVFTDLEGRIFRGEFLGMKDDLVTIKKEDGQVYTLKATGFCPADIAYFRQQSSAHGAEASSTVGETGPNLLVNGSFEKGLEGWTFSAWGRHGKAALDSEVKFDGKPSLRIQNPQGDDSFATQTIQVKPHTRYRLSGFIKTDGTHSENPKGKGGASLAVKGGFDATKRIFGTTEWTLCSMDYDTKDKTEISLGVRVGFYGDLSLGTAWFSKITLVELVKNAH